MESEVIDWDTLTAVCAGLYGSRRLDTEARIGYELELLDGFSPGSIEGKGALLEKKTDLALQLQDLAGGRRREQLLRRSDLDQDLLLRRQRQAELRLRDVHDSGTEEWTAQYRRILQSREKQLEEFAQAYEAGEKEWGRRWTRLLASRNRAIEKFLGGAPGDDERGLPEEIGREAVSLPGNETVEKSSYDYIFEKLDEERLEADTIFSPSPLPDGSPPSPRPSRRLIALELTRRTDELTENLEKHLLSVEASEANRIYGEFLATLDERIGRANDEVDRRIASVLESSGYRRAGESFLRNSVVDKTLLGGTEKTRHSIEGYRRFSLPFRISSPLEGLGGLINVSSEAVRAALKRAGETLAAYSGLIFGSGESPEPGPGKDKGFDGHLAYFYRLRDSISRLVPDSVEAPDGLFAAHVGVPPEADEEDPGKFIHEGFGELGRIFTRYYRFELDLGRGLARLSQVWYDQRLWDDDADNDGEADTWFRAPTARGIIDFTLDAVLNICIPGGGYLLSMADDFAFSMADVSAGRATFDEVLISLGAKMLTRFAGFGIDTFFGGFQESAAAIAANSFERISSAILLEGSSTVLNNLSSGLIGGVSYTSGEGFGFDVEVLENYLYGRDAVSGYVSSGLGSAVTAGLEGIRIELPKEWEILEGYDVGIDFKDIRGFNHTLGRIIGTAGALAVTGGATLNILNLRDVGRFFGAGELFPDQGLIELHLGGGPFLEIGGGGTDISVTALKSLIGGFGETVELIRTGKDVSRAYDIIADMQSVTDRVIGRDEYPFSGGSGAAAVIAAVLESRRREISSGNLYELYADLTPASERHADENLMLAFAQGDVGAYEFLSERLFDSRGSFLLAHYLLGEGVVTLEDMVATDKVYAGSGHTDGVVLGLREALLSEYFAEELAVAGELLDGIIDPREYLTEKILAGKGSTLAEELAAIGEARIRELALYANLPGSDERTLTGLLAAYTESLMAVHELGFRPPPSAPAAAGVLQSFDGPEGPLYAPVRDTDERGIRVTSGYGYRLIDESLKGVIAGEPYGWAEHEHRAVDIAVSPGGEYYAVTDGTLGLVWDDNKGLGVKLLIGGDEKRRLIYWHNDPHAVQDIGTAILGTGSEFVHAGTVIGRSGDTGASTGPHLHLEYYEDVKLKDPLIFLSKTNYYA
ncbi:MAG: M23 family metallopeptidase, partial [Spirochaetota bacterium]